MDFQVREAVRNALTNTFGAEKRTRYTVVATTDDGVVLVNESGEAYEVMVRKL